MNRREFIKKGSLLAVAAPAVIRMAGLMPTKSYLLSDLMPYTELTMPYVPYYGKSVAQMILEQQFMKTKETMAANVMRDLWAESA